MQRRQSVGSPHSLRLPSGERRIDSKKKKKKKSVGSLPSGERRIDSKIEIKKVGWEEVPMCRDEQIHAQIFY